VDLGIGMDLGFNSLSGRNYGECKERYSIHYVLRKMAPKVLLSFPPKYKEILSWGSLYITFN
jgi:hypothetical protein